MQPTMDPVGANEANHRYDDFIQAIERNFSVVVKNCKGALFTTDATDLFTTFLENLPAEYRQHYTCNACRRFVDRFGGLVFIDDMNQTWPAIWPDEVPPFFAFAVEAIVQKVKAAKVTGVFLSNKTVWGEPVTGEWHHMSVKMDTPLIKPSALYTMEQLMAERKEDFKMLMGALQEYDLSTATQALRILESDTLYRADKVKGVGLFFANLSRDWHAAKRARIKDNVVWKAVAQAHAGFCHVKSSMIGTLLDDIKAGLAYEDVAARFKAKMNPLQYQRPQVAPSAGNIEQAEKIVEKLGVASALRRRFARLEEVPTIWKPVEAKAPGLQKGVFDHLKAVPKGAEGMDLPEVTMTWEKFAREILPKALKMEVWTPTRGSFCALTTAVDPDAAPILQWDTPEVRNPVAWYLYSNGSSPAQWSIRSGWNDLTGICLKPTHWNGRVSPNNDPGIVLLIKGAKDVSEANHLCLFPETLKSDFHSIRSTIEEFSRRGKLEGREEASACGLMFGGNRADPVLVRVTMELGRQKYQIDRWD